MTTRQTKVVNEFDIRVCWPSRMSGAQYEAG
jgi:hypothetical protein